MAEIKVRLHFYYQDEFLENFPEVMMLAAPDISHKKQKL
jgi:hypothetical protein